MALNACLPGDKVPGEVYTPDIYPQEPGIEIGNQSNPFQRAYIAYLYTWNGTAWTDNYTGPSGPSGPAGPKGETGEQGDAGLPGPNSVNSTTTSSNITGLIKGDGSVIQVAIPNVDYTLLSSGRNIWAQKSTPTAVNIGDLWVQIWPAGVQTFNGTSSDGFNYPNGNVSYATAHNAASADQQQTTLVHAESDNDKSGSLYYVARSYLYFDTSSLPDYCDVLSANVSLYGSTHYSAAGYVETDADQPDLGLVQGVQSDPLIMTDYGAELSKVTLGHASYYDVSTSWVTNTYNIIPLNSTGISWITLTGTTKFCARTRGDICNSTPTGDNYVDWNTNEKGAGYKPLLTVKYSLSFNMYFWDGSTWQSILRL